MQTLARGTEIGPRGLRRGRHVRSWSTSESNIASAVIQDLTLPSPDLRKETRVREESENMGGGGGRGDGGPGAQTKG